MKFEIIETEIQNTSTKPTPKKKTQNSTSGLASNIDFNKKIKSFNMLIKKFQQPNKTSSHPAIKKSTNKTHQKHKIWHLGINKPGQKFTPQR